MAAARSSPLDHVMDALAPREQVEACRWFEPVEGKERPVRNARLTYALIGGLTVEQVEKIAGIELKSLIKSASPQVTSSTR